MVAFDQLFDSFVINLKRQPERLQAFRYRNTPSEIHFHHFEAIDGAQCPPVANYTPGAVGNAMSHLALWRRCAEQGKSFVVLEDDVVIRHDIKARLPSLVAQVAGWDIILLGYNFDASLELNIAPGINFSGDFSARYPTEQHLARFSRSTVQIGSQRLVSAFGICGYVISPKGAKNLIDRCFPLDSRTVILRRAGRSISAYTLDCMMTTIYRHMLAYACLPPLVMTPNNPKTSTTRRSGAPRPTTR